MTVRDDVRAPRFHLSLGVRPERLEAMVAFYAALFGVPPRKQHADHVQFDLADPPLNLTFVPRASAARGEVDHLGLQVFSEAALRGARTRLRAAGLAIREEPAVECCYAKQDKFWLTDPEGREVEVFHKLADIEHHGRRAGQVVELPAASATAMATPATASTAAATGAVAACCTPECCQPASGEPA